jgi:hypothetical protein
LPLASVVAFKLADESRTVTATPARAVPVVLLTVPLALQAAKVEVVPNTATAAIRDLPRMEPIGIFMIYSIVWGVPV